MSMVHPEALAIYAFARLRHIDSGDMRLQTDKVMCFRIR